jgi:hypothetical protein
MKNWKEAAINFQIGFTCFFPDLYDFPYLLCFQGYTQLKIQGRGGLDFLGLNVFPEN